jgi:menaquinone-dependent protoporphyrinogen IX oxidase
MKKKSNTDGIVVYWSKYGCTKQYAQWLRDETGYPIRATSAPFAPSMKKARVILVGSSIRVGKLKIAPWIRRHWKEIKDKQIIVFSTSALSPDDMSLQEIWGKCLPPEIRTSCEYFPLPGRLIYKKLNLSDKLKLWADATSSGDTEVKDGMKKGFDAMDKKMLAPILDLIKNSKKRRTP